MKEETLRKDVQIPPLTPDQWMIVAGALGTVLNLMGTAYGRALGPGRISELVEFKRELIQSVLNTEVSGLLESQEPAVIKAVADLLRASIPDVAS